MADNTYAIDLESGSSQYFSITDASQTGLDFSTTFTFEMFVRLESVLSTNTLRALIFKDTTGQRSYLWQLTDTSGTKLVQAAVIDSGGNQDFYQWNFTPVAGVDYHLALTCDTGNASASTFELFVNGFSYGNGTQIIGDNISTINNGTADVVIGARQVPDRYFDGIIDEVRFWSDVRTVTEIRDNMFEDVSGQAGLVTYLKLNNDYTDSEGSNDFTATNAPSFTTTVPFPEYTGINSLALEDTSLIDDANLQEYYRLEDLTGENGNTLTNNNTATFVSAKFNDGVSGGSSDTDKSLSVASDLGYDGGAYSISFWFKANVAPSNQRFSLANVTDSTSITGLTTIYRDSSGVKRIGFGRNRWNTAQDIIYLDGFDFGTTIFHHVVITYDGSTVRGYVNGILFGTVASSGNGSFSATELASLLAPTNGLTIDNGLVTIDDCAFFDDELTPTEIFELYTGLNAVVASATKPYRSLLGVGS